MEDRKNDFTPDRHQKEAIDHIGSPARLLACPGAGKTKTLTHRIISLIKNHGVAPEKILALAFTRLAAAQLKKDIKDEIESLDLAPQEQPHISTIHTFALRQLVHNEIPIRIADNWEQREIIYKDIEKAMRDSKINFKYMFDKMFEGWATLKEDFHKNDEYQEFFAAWEKHKSLYGETLLNELVYKFEKELKKESENGQTGFNLSEQYQHILVDEYQDLTPCELEAINKIVKLGGAELFAVGDDDQSIYGFRHATLDGFRKFEEHYEDATLLELEICFRCDKKILKAGKDIIERSGDSGRLEKKIHAQDGAEDGEIGKVQFNDQYDEARFIAHKIKELNDSNTKLNEIVILFRSNYKEWFSNPIIEALEKLNINASRTSDSQLDEEKQYGVFLSIIRLMENSSDSLAWRRLIKQKEPRTWNEMDEDRIIEIVEEYATEQQCKFGEALQKIAKSPSVIEEFGSSISDFVCTQSEIIKKLKSEIKKLEISNEKEKLSEYIVDKFFTEEGIKSQVKKLLDEVLNEQENINLKTLPNEIILANSGTAQNTQEDAVKLLTMHKAKGLTFEVCFIIAAEQQYIPGRNRREFLEDERRLLYVSITRACHKVFITYCKERIDCQSGTGKRNKNQPRERRHLTEFLADERVSIPDLDNHFKPRG